MDGGRDDAEGHQQRDVVVEHGAHQVWAETGKVEGVFHHTRGGHGEREVEGDEADGEGCRGSSHVHKQDPRGREAFGLGVAEGLAREFVDRGDALVSGRRGDQSGGHGGNGSGHGQLAVGEDGEARREQGNGKGQESEGEGGRRVIDRAAAVSCAEKAEGEGDAVGEDEGEQGEAEGARALGAEPVEDGDAVGAHAEAKGEGLQGPATVLGFGEDGGDTIRARQGLVVDAGGEPPLPPSHHAGVRLLGRHAGTDACVPAREVRRHAQQASHACDVVWCLAWAERVHESAEGEGVELEEGRSPGEGAVCGLAVNGAADDGGSEIDGALFPEAGPERDGVFRSGEGSRGGQAHTFCDRLEGHGQPAAGFRSERVEVREDVGQSGAPKANEFSCGAVAGALGQLLKCL